MQALFSGFFHACESAEVNKDCTIPGTHLLGDNTGIVRRQEPRSDGRQVGRHQVEVTMRCDGMAHLPERHELKRGFLLLVHEHAGLPHHCERRKESRLWANYVADNDTGNSCLLFSADSCRKRPWVMWGPLNRLRLAVEERGAGYSSNGASGNLAFPEADSSIDLSQDLFHLFSKSTGSLTSVTRKYCANDGYFRATASYMAYATLR